MPENKKGNLSRRTVLKSAGASSSFALLGYSMAQPAAASHIDDTSYVQVTEDDIPGWESCAFLNYQYVYAGWHGSVRSGPCYSGDVEYWEVCLDQTEPLWIRHDWLAYMRDKDSSDDC